MWNFVKENVLNKALYIKPFDIVSTSVANTSCYTVGISYISYLFCPEYGKVSRLLLPPVNYESDLLGWMLMTFGSGEISIG